MVTSLIAAAEALCIAAKIKSAVATRPRAIAASADARRGQLWPMWNLRLKAEGKQVFRGSGLWIACAVHLVFCRSCTIGVKAPRVEVAAGGVILSLPCIKSIFQMSPFAG